PPDLKLVLLLGNPATALTICNDETITAFKQLCSNTKYWTKLYNKEFSIYQTADAKKYFSSIIRWEMLNKEYIESIILHGAVSEGWEIKAFPLLEKKEDLFKNIHNLYD